MKESPEKAKLSGQELRSDSGLEERLKQTIAAGDKEKLRRLKREYEAKFGGPQERIEVLFGMVDFLNRQHFIETSKHRNAHIPRETFQLQTEYNFALTHFIKQGGGGESLEDYWNLLNEAGRAKGNYDKAIVERLRTGVTTQVAVAKAFEMIGGNASLSHPSEDAFKSTDLWEEGHPVQIKGTHKAEEPAFIEVPAVTYPGVSVKAGDHESHYTSHYDEEIDRFSFKIGTYGERLGRDMRGYFVVVPDRMVDRSTGEPSAELVEYFRNHVPDKPEVV
jgi:hypothetical protein